MSSNFAVIGDNPTDADDIVDGMDFRDGAPIAEDGTVPALYLGWCAIHDKLSDRFASENESLITRLKLRDLSCLEFFTLAAKGQLRKSMLGNHHAALTASGIYDDFRRRVLEVATESDDRDWRLYDAVAGWLTARMGRTKRSRRWWEMWSWRDG